MPVAYQWRASWASASSASAQACSGSFSATARRPQSTCATYQSRSAWSWHASRRPGSGTVRPANRSAAVGRTFLRHCGWGGHVPPYGAYRILLPYGSAHQTSLPPDVGYYEFNLVSAFTGVLSSCCDFLYAEAVALKIFLSWSGGKSRALAEELRDWLPYVVQSVDPFVSTQDISTGARSLNVLASELETASFGIVCLTQQNKLTPWITFEAGAMSKIVNTSKVIPLLLDLRISDLTGPLAQFQAVEAGDKEQIFKMIRAISAVSPQPLPEDRLKGTFDVFWPRLQERVANLRQPNAEADDHDTRSDRDILEELLALARRNEREITRIRTENAEQPILISEQVLNDRQTAAIIAESNRATRENRLVKEIAELVRGWSYILSKDQDGFHLTFDPSNAGTEEDVSIDASGLRATLEAMARVLGTPIFVRGGPIGNEAFPPF
jgi:hypothetical protein